MYGRLRTTSPPTTPTETALKPPVAAVSVGVVGGEVVLDLPYLEDSKADVDMNVVGSEDGTLIEVQGTAEHGTFDRKQLDAMLDLADRRHPAARPGPAPGLPRASARTRPPLVFATRNPGKLVELRQLLPDIDVLGVEEAAARLGHDDPRRRRGRRHVRRQRDQEGA